MTIVIAVLGAITYVAAFTWLLLFLKRTKILVYEIESMTVRCLAYVVLLLASPVVLYIGSCVIVGTLIGDVLKYVARTGVEQIYAIIQMIAQTSRSAVND